MKRCVDSRCESHTGCAMFISEKERTPQTQFFRFKRTIFQSRCPKFLHKGDEHASEGH